MEAFYQCYMNILVALGQADVFHPEADFVLNNEDVSIM